MSQLTANLGSTLQVKYGSIQTHTAGGTIYRGATVVIKIADGLAYAAEDDTDDSEKQIVVGFAMEEATITESIRIRKDGKMKRTMVGSPTYVVGRLALVKSDNEVQLYNDGSECTVVVGRITEAISASEVYVDFTDRPARLATGVND